jgi:hypothetical protein
VNTADILTRACNLNETFSDIVQLALLEFHPFPQRLYLSKGHNHGNEIFLNPILLINIGTQFQLEPINLLVKLFNNMFQSISFLSIEFQPKLKFLRSLLLFPYHVLLLIYLKLLDLMSQQSFILYKLLYLIL